MIESKHEIGSNGWYDDLSAHLLAQGKEPTAEVITLEVARIQGEEKIRIRPDTRREEARARERGEIPDGMTYDEWLESTLAQQIPHLIKDWPEIERWWADRKRDEALGDKEKKSRELT